MGLRESWRAYWRRTGVFRACLEDPESAQKALLDEQKMIESELKKTVEVYRLRLAALREHMYTTDPEIIERETQMMQQTQTALKRVIERIAVAEKDTQTLLDEWQEWQSLSFDDDRRKEASARQEMIASELCVRGVQHRSSSTSVEIRRDQPSEGMSATIDTDDTHEWERHIAPHILNSVHYWEAALRSDDDALPHSHLATVAKALRQSHGALRVLDRQTNTTRDRVSSLGRKNDIG